MTHSGIALIDPHKIFSAIELKPGARVADLGCGRTGHFVFMASRLIGEGGVVYAVDIMKDVLENIKNRAKSEGYYNVETVWSDLEKTSALPIPEKSLDACFLVNVAYALSDQATALKEAGRLLKENGYLVVVDWAKNIGSFGPLSNQLIDRSKFKALAEAVGLSFVREMPAGDYHFCLIFKK